jgi:hypothetical protein
MWTFGSSPITGILNYEYEWTRGSSSTTACRWSLSSSRQNQSTSSYPSSLISTSLLLSNLYFNFPNSLFYSGFTTEHLACISFGAYSNNKSSFCGCHRNKLTGIQCVTEWCCQLLRLYGITYRWSTGAIILTEKTEVLGEKFIPVPPCLPQIPHGLAWDRSWASSQKPATHCLRYDMARKSKRKMVQSISDFSIKNHVIWSKWDSHVNRKRISKTNNTYACVW